MGYIGKLNRKIYKLNQKKLEYLSTFSEEERHIIKIIHENNDITNIELFRRFLKIKTVLNVDNIKIYREYTNIIGKLKNEKIIGYHVYIIDNDNEIPQYEYLKTHKINKDDFRNFINTMRKNNKLVTRYTLTYDGNELILELMNIHIPDIEIIDIDSIN